MWSMSQVLPSQDYLSSQEAATELGLTDGRIRQMLLAGEINGQKLGERVWAIPSVEVDRVKREREKRRDK